MIPLQEACEAGEDLYLREKLEFFYKGIVEAYKDGILLEGTAEKLSRY